MPNYRRILTDGGTYFFTVVTNERIPLFSNSQDVELLQRIIADTQKRYPFEQQAYCILPNHIHCIWKLPEGDHDYSIRWQVIKALVTRKLGSKANLEGPISESRKRKRERGIWQRRFWEHTIRDDEDLARDIHYIHFNPIKHGLVKKLSDWRWSSFHDYVKEGYYDEDWGDLEPDNIKGLGDLE